MNKYHYVVNGYIGKVLVGCYSTYEKAVESFDSFRNVKHDDRCQNKLIEGAILADNKPYHTEYRCTCGVIEMAEICQVVIDKPLL